MRYLLTSEGLFDFFKKKNETTIEGLEEINYSTFERWYSTKDREMFSLSESEKMCSILKPSDWVVTPATWSKSLERWMSTGSSTSFRRKSGKNISSVIITKYVDEWYIIEAESRAPYSRNFPRKEDIYKYYLCDQFDSVIKFLENNL